MTKGNSDEHASWWTEVKEHPKHRFGLSYSRWKIKEEKWIYLAYLLASGRAEEVHGPPIRIVCLDRGRQRSTLEVRKLTLWSSEEKSTVTIHESDILWKLNWAVVKHQQTFVEFSISSLPDAVGRKNIAANLSTPVTYTVNTKTCTVKRSLLRSVGT